MTNDEPKEATTSQPGRLQVLLEKLSPEARIERLRKDRDALQERLFDALAQARLQDALVERAQAAVEAAADRPDETIVIDGHPTSRAERDRLDLATARYYADANWRVLDATMGELEAVLADLEGAAQVGTRAERRRSGRGR